MSTSATKPLRKAKSSAGAPPHRVYGGVEREDRVRVRRQRFLEAGVQVFGTRGYRAATVRAICEEAKLTDRYYYESFSSLEDYLLAVYLMLVADLESAVVDAV